MLKLYLDEKERHECNNADNQLNSSDDKIIIDDKMRFERFRSNNVHENQHVCPLNVNLREKQQKSGGFYSKC